MLISVTQPVGSSNPGIVPTWLQQSTAPQQAATAAAPAPVGATDPDAVQVSGPVADAKAGAVATLDSTGSRPSAAAGIDELREQKRLEQTVADVQQRFRAMGVKDSEGNGPVLARFNPRYPNASYAPDGVPSRNIPADSITVGVDPRDMQPFTNAKDVIAHELAHRIVHHMVKQPLSMSATSADVAIHETLADTFASLVDDKDWIIGDKLSEPIRVMNDPGQLGHPGHVEDLARVMAPDSPFMHPVGKSARTGKTVLAPDWHAVAGIPNRAASIIGDALGREKLGKIYFQAVREHLQPGKQLQGLAAAVLLSAQDLYGAESREFKTTADAWAAVGVLDQSRAA